MNSCRHSGHVTESSGCRWTTTPMPFGVSGGWFRMSVRQLIQHRIEEGRLPRERTIELWHSPGFGQPCDGCGAAITTAETMCLICGDDWRAFRFHRGCFEVWDAERSLGQHDK